MHAALGGKAGSQLPAKEEIGRQGYNPEEWNCAANLRELGSRFLPGVSRRLAVLKKLRFCLCEKLMQRTRGVMLS